MSKVAKAVAGQIFKPYSRLYGSAKSLAGTVADARDAVREAKAQAQAQSGDEVAESGRGIADDRARFEYHFKARGWTDEGLAAQRRMLIKHQTVYLVYSVVAAALFAGVAYFGGSWAPLASFMTAIMFLLTFAVLGLKTLHCAMMACQIDERSLLSFFDFMGRADAGRRLLMPWAKQHREVDLAP